MNIFMNEFEFIYQGAFYLVIFFLFLFSPIISFLISAVVAANGEGLLHKIHSHDC